MQILLISLLMIFLNKIKKYIFWSLTKNLKEKFDNNYPIFDMFFQKSIYNILILSKRIIPDKSLGMLFQKSNNSIVQRVAKNHRRQGAMEGYYRVSRSQQPLSSWGMQNALGSQAKARLSGHHSGRFCI